MSKTENATQWMINLANNNSHGYDQTKRWGEKGDYDCSSAVISAWQAAGVPVKTNGASYTGNMKSVFLKTGFSDVTSKITLSSGAGLKRGDVLLNTSSHTAMFIGNGQIVHASINENGKTTGGKPGDQTGKEICIRSYYNKPWNCILRYKENGGGGNTPTPTPSGNSVVKAGQREANSFTGSNIDVDGKRGPATKKAGIKALQKAMNLDYKSGLTVDGVWGDKSKAALGKHYVKSGETQYMVTAAEILVMLRGYNPNGVEKPGKFGDGLKNAVNSFKKSVGLSQNGICDSATFLKLIQ